MIKDLLGYLVKSLVDDPSQVNINQIEGDTAIVLELTVAKEDIGRVIGKEGKVIKAIRILINAASIKIKKRVTVEVLG